MRSGIIFKSAFILLFTPSILFSQSWFTQSSGVTSHLLSVYFIDANTGWCGTEDGKVLKTTNGGSIWSAYSTGQSIGINSLYFISSTAGFACCDIGYILTTVNGGINWSTQVSSTTSSLFKIRFINSSTGWAAGDFRTIVKTTNSGTTWVTQISGSNAHYSVFPLTASTIFACGFDGVVYKSTNGGNNWYVPNSNTAYVLNDIYFPSITTGIAIGYGTPIPSVLRTTNSGENWAIVPTVEGSGLNALHFPAALSGWACGYEGQIMNTTNAGATWLYQLTAAPGIILKDIFFANSTTGWCVGYLGTILKTTNGGITGLIQTGEIIPVNFELYQNYPNPFNPVTNIKFDIAEKTYVEISIYDILGKKIKNVVNQIMIKGSYSIEFSSKFLSSGLYFYSLKTQKYSKIRKMIIIK